MSGLFLSIFNMSVSASWVVVIVLLLRLVLKKAPKWINVLLWGMVAIRLVCPFSIESSVSLVPSAQTITMAPDAHKPYFESGVTVLDNQVNEYLGGNYFEGVTRPTGNFVNITTILGIVWIVGVAAMLIYAIVSFVKIKHKLSTAVLMRDNIYQSENVTSPFVLGFIKPKIYLPFNIGIQDMVYVVAHENAHIHRKDHLWKPIGFMILAVHWFNPLVWLGYLLFCRDIELACDEKVVGRLDNEQKADYSQALLTCSVSRRIIAACPLAFGEMGIKKRVKSVLNYKKPAFWIVAAAVVVSIAVAVCFLTNPPSDKTEDKKESSSDIVSSETILNENSKNGEWVACETINKAGKPTKSTHFDPFGKKVTEIIYDSEGNGTYTYFYEDGSVAPARTYDIGWYEDGSYLYRRLVYHDNGKPAMVSTYAENGRVTHYYRYNDKGEVIEEKSFDKQTGDEVYCLKTSYKYRADGTVSEQIFKQGDDSYYQTYYVNQQGLVYKATYNDGSSENFNEPLLKASIYYEPIFYNEY